MNHNLHSFNEIAAPISTITPKDPCLPLLDLKTLDGECICDAGVLYGQLDIWLVFKIWGN